jgi:hypothetical protein
MRLSVGDPKLFAYYLPAMAHKAFHHLGLFIEALTSFGLFIGTFPRSGLINRMPPGLQYNQQCSPMSLDFQSSGLSSTLAYQLSIPSSDYVRDANPKWRFPFPRANHVRLARCHRCSVSPRRAQSTESLMDLCRDFTAGTMLLGNLGTNP